MSEQNTLPVAAEIVPPDSVLYYCPRKPLKQDHLESIATFYCSLPAAVEAQFELSSMLRYGNSDL